MKRTFLLSIVVALVLSSSALSETITILHLNDTHAHLTPYGPKDAGGYGQWGGYARLATLVGMNRATEPNVMLLHGGDFSVGDFMFQKYLGIPELELMKGLGFDALTLGNHEFDLYPSTLKYELTTAGFPGGGFPVLCANLDMTADPEMAYFVQPYTIKTYGTVKVGIFGLTTEFANSGSNVAPLVVLPPLDVAQDWIDSLKNGLGCNVVILLSHLGTAMDQVVASNTTGLDVIVGGHTHTTIPEPVTVGGTLIVQAGELAHYLGKLQLTVQAGVLTSYDYQLVPVDQNIPEAPSVRGMLDALVTGLEADPRFGPVFSQPAAQAAMDLYGEFGQELVMDNQLGNLIADAYRATTGTDIALHPQGFINQNVWAGPVTGNDIFRVVPYGFDPASGLGFKVATFRTTGMSIFAGLEFSVYNLPYMTDFFQHGSNISFAYNSDNPPGERVDYASVMISGIPADPLGVYTVSVPEGVLPFLAQIPGFTIDDAVVTDNFMYTVVKDFMAAHSPVKYYREGRVLDLAALSDPVAGLTAISGLIDLMVNNGMINKAVVASNLRMKYALVSKHLQAGRTNAALSVLAGIGTYLRDQSAAGFISPIASARLQYLQSKMDEFIVGPSLAYKEEAGSGLTLPTAFDLMQNYPNPFNPSTTINFSMPTAGEYKLTIYNVTGQVVKEFTGHCEAGELSIPWDASGLGSGVYLYKLSAGTFSETKKMMLLK